MNTATLPATLSVGSVPIHQHNRLYSLNDLHRASGGEEKHQPAKFVRLDTTQALIAEISNSPDVANYNPIETVRGKYGGTYACKELVIAYASWISAEFHLKVIRVFLDATASPAQPLPPPVPTKTLTFTVPANDRTSRWLLHTDRTGREVVTELPPETHVIHPDQWIHRLMHSPADLNLTLSQMLTITQACLNNMRTSAGTYASRLNIQPVKHTPAPRGQFASLGIPPTTETGDRP